MINIHSANLIRAYIERQPAKEFTSWRASQIGQCPRAHFLKRAGVAETIPKDDITLRKFLAGDLFHDFLGRLTTEEVERLGGTVSTEQELYDKELDLGGRYDQLIELDDFRQLRDVKSQHSGLFHRLKRGQKEKLAKPWEETSEEERQRAMKEVVWQEYPYWVKQLAAYMLLLKRAGTPVNEGVIVRVSKDDLSLAEVHYELTPELEKIVLDELALLNKHWEEKSLPPCTCPTLYNGKGIHYCDYGDPDSEEYVTLEGKKYKEKLRTKCCSEELWKK